MKNKGFTLVELLVCIVILMISISLIVPLMLDDRSDIKTQQKIETVQPATPVAPVQNTQEESSEKSL
jgi:prepilin-type N-terminal cleavage/methylation domain-containing protein